MLDRRGPSRRGDDREGWLLKELSFKAALEGVVSGIVFQTLGDWSLLLNFEVWVDGVKYRADQW